MKRPLSFLLLCVLTLAGPASAMAARRDIDADYRSSFPLPSDRLTLDISGDEQPLDPLTPEIHEDARQPPQPQRAVPVTPASDVPEPSGFAMLVCGLLLLLLVPYKRAEELFRPVRDQS